MNCACMSVGKPGYGAVRTLAALRPFARRTRSVVALAATSAPASASLSITASSVSGRAPTIVTSPPAAAAAASKRPRLDAVRHDGVRRAVQLRYAFDGDAIGAGAGDARAHRAQAHGEVGDLRLARGILQHRDAFGEGRGHHQVLGAGDGDHVEHESRA